jgi:hypothetical protein
VSEDNKDIEPKVRDLNRARQSLVEELEAMIWYDERISATKDSSLAKVLAYNRDDEKEHASLLLAWLSKHDDALKKEMSKAGV